MLQSSIPCPEPEPEHLYATLEEIFDTISEHRYDEPPEDIGIGINGGTDG